MDIVNQVESLKWNKIRSCHTFIIKCQFNGSPVEFCECEFMAIDQFLSISGEIIECAVKSFGKCRFEQLFPFWRFSFFLSISRIKQQLVMQTYVF